MKKFFAKFYFCFMNVYLAENRKRLKNSERMISAKVNFLHIKSSEYYCKQKKKVNFEVYFENAVKYLLVLLFSGLVSSRYQETLAKVYQ